MQEHLPEPVELDGGWGDYLEAMEDAMQEVRRALAEKHPEEFKLLARGKRNPHASLSFHVYAHHEALALQKMRATCGNAAFSPEHDGIAAQGDPQQLLDVCAKAVAPLRVAIKEYPADPMAAFRARFPELDWDIKANTSIRDYAGLLQKCRGLLQAQRQRGATHLPSRSLWPRASRPSLTSQPQKARSERILRCSQVMGIGTAVIATT